MDNRSDIREFLATRRARLSPTQVGLAAGGGRRRVPGLRREEVAVLAGVSTEWYSRLEKGHITGVSDEVLEAVARALQLNGEERGYLFDLARAARPSAAGAGRRRSPKNAEVPPSVQWMLDAMTGSAALLSNARLDIVATNALGRAMYAPAFDGPGAGPSGVPNFARHNFLDPDCRDFYEDWDNAANQTVAILRAQAGRNPSDKALRDLVGELSTLSPEFRTRWAAHDVRTHHAGTKGFHHPVVGPMQLTYHSLTVPVGLQTEYSLAVYTAEPASPSAERFGLLASWAAPLVGDVTTNS